MMLEKKKYYLGIDIGTSSAKAIARSADGEAFKAKQEYKGCEPDAWRDAVKALIAKFNESVDGRIAAISFSSQVGTYIVNGKDVISWRSSVGKEELGRIKDIVSDEEFINEIGMKHPDLISYPLPRLAYIQKLYGAGAEVIMPKELLIRELTGSTVTDVFSMRGIADPKKVRYATGIMDKLQIKITLPELKLPTDLAGRVTESAAKEYGLAPNTPVYLGCNDFFAGLLGMGIYSECDFFDLSGTSEHIGYISSDANSEGFVSGGYFNGNCTYGGTKSSGASCDFAIRNFGIDGIELDRVLTKKPPIFLPYLCGERAPIFDENARGVYFGLSDKTDKESLAYATLEGVVFSLYDIAISMGSPKPDRLICGGGSAKNRLMNTLRATLFDCETVSVCENDTSALGACILAMVGDGLFADIPSAIRACVEYGESVSPDIKYRDALKKRFEIYKTLYGNLAQTFEKFNNI